jgi:sugar lactone lactonase YvrE
MPQEIGTSDILSAKGRFIAAFVLYAFPDLINIMIKRIFYFSLFAAIITSCTRDFTKSSSGNDLVIYPPPPDTTRIQYLTSISTSTDIKGKQSGFSKFISGEEVPKPIIKPYGVTVSDSKVYICDTGLGGLVIMDLAGKSFEYFIPSGKGQLQLPFNCSVDSIGNLYVADGNRRQIVVFDRDGRYVNAFGEQGETFKPTDVSVNGNKIYVASVKDQKIFVYDRNSDTLLFSFPSMEPGDDGFLYQPTNIFVGHSSIYVSDLGDNKVKVYSLEGKFQNFIGGFGNYVGQMQRPKGVTVDNKSNVFVVDAAFENVQIFNKDGKVLMFFGGPYYSHGDMWLPADVTVSYNTNEYFSKFVDESFDLIYLIFVTNQYGPDKVSVYGFVKPKKKGNPDGKNK